MNIAYFILPRANVAFLYDDFSVRQALEKLRFHGYTAIPVVTRENKYVCTVSEGDFLWYLVRDEKDGAPTADLRSMENVPLRDVMRADKNPPVHITASVEELLTRAMHQNFVPVIDDRGYFVGIITRQDIIRYFSASVLHPDISREKIAAAPPQSTQI